LTRPGFKDIYEKNPSVNNIYYANFPMGTKKDFNFFELIQLLKVIKTLSNNKYDIVLNNIGDIRENLLGKLINPKQNISLIYDKDHPFKNLIRLNSSLFLDRYIFVPKDVRNIYEIQRYFLKELGCSQILPPKIYLSEKYCTEETINKKIIGIHPFASQPSKIWSFDNWKSLINDLKSEYVIWIFGSKDDEVTLNKFFSDIIDQKGVFVKTGSLSNFFLNLSRCSLLIGLDSFSIHAASALGIKGIMLNGSNDWEIWKPDNVYVISKGKEFCKFYPCFNKPKCKGKDYEFICMNSINKGDVLSLMNEIL